MNPSIAALEAAPSAPSAPKVLVLGVGNTLLADEGVGVHALAQMQRSYGDLPDVQLLDGGTLSFVLASAIEMAGSLVVFDAAQLKAPPGTVRLFEGEEMDRFLGTSRRSVHEVGLVDLLAMARLTGRLPEGRALIGIQPHYLGWGETCTGAVAGALPEACRLAAEVIHRWRR